MQNKARPFVRKPDRRSKKTQRALRTALHSLIDEKPYDAIVVQEILDRARVGRSTFYTHYAGKDELLVNTIAEMVDRARSESRSPSGAWRERMLTFSRPIFEYHYQHRHKEQSRIDEHGWAHIHGHLQHVLSDAIADTIASEYPGAEAGRISRELLLDYVVSTFLLVFTRWKKSGAVIPPAEIDATFRALVLPTLAAVR